MMVIIGLTPIELGNRRAVGDVEGLGAVDGAVRPDDAAARGSASIRAVPIG